MVTTEFDADGVEYLVPPPGLEDFPKYLLKMSFLRHTRVPDLYASSIILSVLALIAVVLRCKVRRKTKQFGWDDYTIILGLVFFWAMSLSIMIFIHRAGLGGHDALISDAQNEEFWGVCLIELQILYLCTMGSIKVSILLLYHRVFGVSRRFRFAIFGALAMTACWFIALVILTVLSSGLLDGYQLVPETSAKIGAISNLGTDLIILFLPIRMVWRLEMKWQTKVKLIGLFLLGLFVCITSLVRIVYLVQYDGGDEVYESAKVVVWTVAECGLSIITASLPIIRLLFHSPPAPTSDGYQSSYFSSRKKSFVTRSLKTLTRDKYSRRGWSSTESHDESQVEIVQGDGVVPSGKRAPSKDEEMNWGTIELTERGNGRSVTNSKLS